MAKKPGGPDHVLDLRKASIGGEHLLAANDPHAAEAVAQLAAQAEADSPLNEQALADAQRFATGLPELGEDAS